SHTSSGKSVPAIFRLFRAKRAQGSFPMPFFSRYRVVVTLVVSVVVVAVISPSRPSMMSFAASPAPPMMSIAAFPSPPTMS
ncbi:MAG: hypothetical protein Q4A05_02195, partial [Ruminococcus sp.]|nr:hypothetical protein [Ruminococcus sp.]